MAIDLFHPAVQNWFSKQFAGPTEPQKRAWPSIARGQHTLIAAPTGSGKTLAAFLSAINDLVERSAIDEPSTGNISTLPEKRDVRNPRKTSLLHREPEGGAECPELVVNCRLRLAGLLLSPDLAFLQPPTSVLLEVVSSEGQGAPVIKHGSNRLQMTLDRCGAPLALIREIRLVRVEHCLDGQPGIFGFG